MSSSSVPAGSLPASAIPAGAFTFPAASVPSKIPDLPASLVLMLIFFSFALLNMRRIFQSKKKFILHGLLIGLCMSRTVTFAIRSAWSLHPEDRALGIAATVFVGAGVILLVVVNMHLVFRLAKTKRPELQNNKLFLRATMGVQWFMLALLVMTIVPAVQNILTTDQDARSRDRIVLKISSTYLAIYACLPFFFAPAVHIFVPYSPRSIARRDRLVYKTLLIMYISALVGTEMTLKMANNFTPLTMGTWYPHRTAFYLLNPMLELLCLIAIIPFDLPHAFGDSNAAVLQAVNRQWEAHGQAQGAGARSKSIESLSGEKDSQHSGKEAKEPAFVSVQEALQATSPNHKPGVWTEVPEELTGRIQQEAA